jgi:hypothetical protein
MKTKAVSIAEVSIYANIFNEGKKNVYFGLCGKNSQ